MEDMRKRPAGDVTVDDASSSSSSSPSAKRRRDHADISVANNVVMSSADSSVAPPLTDVVADSGDVISAPPVLNGVVVAEIGDISVPPRVHDVVEDSGGDIVAPPPVICGVSFHPAVSGGVVSVPPAVNDVVVDIDDMALCEFADSDYLTWNGVTTTLEILTFAENPSRLPKVYQTMSTSYVTINGNEESCGSSFSDAESSVMASVDRNGRDLEQERLDFEFYAAIRWEEWYGESSGFKVDRACDAADVSARELNLDLDSEWDEAALARFIGEDLNSSPQQPPVSGTD